MSNRLFVLVLVGAEPQAATVSTVETLGLSSDCCAMLACVSGCVSACPCICVFVRLCMVCVCLAGV